MRLLRFSVVLALFAQGPSERPRFEPFPGELRLGTPALTNAIADYDGDGDLDIYVGMNGAPNRLYRNHVGSFSDAAPDAGLADARATRSAAWGDYDADGDPDLLLGFAPGPGSILKLYRNEAGRFADITREAGLQRDSAAVRQLSWIDLDSDGDLDLFVAFRDKPNALYRNDGGRFSDIAASLGLADPRKSVGAVWLDYDQDGDLDLYVANQDGDRNGLWRNDSGKFNDMADSAGVAWGGRKPGDPGNGTVRPCAADVDGDGRFDLFAANYGKNGLLLNRGGRFEEVSAAWGIDLDARYDACAFADIDHDGRLDLYVNGTVTGGVSYRDFLYRHTGSRYADVTPDSVVALRADHGAQWADLDGDGDVDLALTGAAPPGTVALLRNLLPQRVAGRSLSVRVLDPRGRAIRAGAEVRLFASGTRRRLGTRLVDTGSGYNAQNDMPVHFGLADLRPVDVEVVWPANGARVMTRVANVRPGDWRGKSLVIRAEAQAPLPRVLANDNRRPAGRVERDTLRLDLAVRRAEWYPESPEGAHITVEAWSEPGSAPSIPAPLIRVREGQAIRATVRNALPDSTIHVIGLATQPVPIADTLHIRPGDSAEVVFSAGAPGTYIYRAVIGNDPDGRPSERETAGGAFVVDPAGGAPPDRIFVINVIAVPLDSARVRNALGINGRAWPHTERIGMAVGDTARWRVVNASTRGHPMHLHGFYFRVDASGDGRVSREVPGERRRLGVTEFMPAWNTRTLAWSPDRAGNWLFHCHLTVHVTPRSRLTDDGRIPDHAHSADPAEHMAGLVLGISVRRRTSATERDAGPRRTLDLHFLEGGPRGRMAKTWSYVLQEGSAAPRPDSIRIPGSTILVHRDERVDIVIHNRAREDGGIHWHGIELESWSDGVVGWSGAGRTVAPRIKPGDTFRARLRLPRAGTFMYHTHMNDLEQITHGAAGPLIVLEPGQPFDASRDHIYLVQWHGEAAPLTQPALLINGDSTEAPSKELTAGVSHRFRLINIGMAGNARFQLRRDTAVVEWRALAKDGADLPPALRVIQPATQQLAVGETWDFELTPTPGIYELTAVQVPVPGFRGTIGPWRQRLVVR